MVRAGGLRHRPPPRQRPVSPAADDHARTSTPLIARELENRTFTLVWNQSITRTRWLLVKLAVTGLAAMAITEALSLLYAWVGRSHR